MKYFCKIIFSFVLIFFSYQTVYPCTCKDPSQRKTFRKAKAVFVGTVVEVKESNNKNVADFLGMQKVYDIKFKVEKSWKGIKDSEITVVSDNGYIACPGNVFVIGKEFMIYATGKDLVVVSMCERNLPIEAAKRDINNLDNFWFRFFARVFSF